MSYVCIMGLCSGAEIAARVRENFPVLQVRTHRVATPEEQKRDESRAKAAATVAAKTEPRRFAP